MFILDAIGLLASLLLAAAVLLIAQELARGRLQRRLQMTIEALDRQKEFDPELERVKAVSRAGELRIDVTSEDELFVAFRYLNGVELLCLGIHKGFYDEAVAYDYVAGSLIQNFRIFQPLIGDLRERSSNPRVYLHLEAVARRWEERRRREMP